MYFNMFLMFNLREPSGNKNVQVNKLKALIYLVVRTTVSEATYT